MIPAAAGVAVRPVGRPKKGESISESDYQVFANIREDGRYRTRSVCTVPAVNKTDAILRGQNFCTALRYEFSHVNRA